MQFLPNPWTILIGLLPTHCYAQNRVPFPDAAVLMTRARRIFSSFLLLGILMGTLVWVRPALASQPNTKTVSGVHVHEKAGTLSRPEAMLLRDLSKKMIPLPDTVRIRIDSVHYGVYSPIGGSVVFLSVDRFRAPDSLSRTAPYLFGRVPATEQIHGTIPPRYTHTLAHEVAHFLSHQLAEAPPRPAWGTAASMSEIRRAREIEAELIAAVLENMSFGTRLSALGYPDSTRVHGVGMRSTRLLAQEYRGIIADTWRLPVSGL